MRANTSLLLLCPRALEHVSSYLRYAESDLGLDVAEHQISSQHLHDHLLGPEATFAVQPLQLGHAVVQRLQLLTVQLTGQKVLGGVTEGRGEQS